VPLSIGRGRRFKDICGERYRFSIAGLFPSKAEKVKGVDDLADILGRIAASSGRDLEKRRILWLSGQLAESAKRFPANDLRPKTRQE
jgi:hypothetical protein